jgi:predicted PhzF superfamily epimerase YddE/YHI9
MKFRPSAIRACEKRCQVYFLANDPEDRESKDKPDTFSRFFVPKGGIAEDSVTGSAHCTLVPFWAKRLGWSELVAHQASPRGGELHCERRGDRVIMSGQCVPFLTGSTHI